jgi:hydroxyacylglutathione hydrolase/adenylyltransferase/sulfurtransferase
MPQDTDIEAEVVPERAAELIAAGAVLIDVRRAYEWDAGRIAGARHIEINEVAREAETIPTDRPVVFYCRTGSRSSLAAAAFRDAGWDAYNLAGGLVAWVDRGNELEPEGGEVIAPRPGS